MKIFKKIITLYLVVLSIFGFTQMIGTATYYGNKFHGKRTASGSIFSMHKFTCAASTKFKFGQLLEITNLKNGKKVIVKVTDRGGAIKHNKIDLSVAAFKAISNLRTGMIKINIKPI